MVLRAIVQSLADEDVADAPLVLHAIGLAEWLWSTRHCPRCGGSLEPRQAGHVLHCTSCGKDQFPRSDPAVIMVVTDGEPGSPEERCLLGSEPAVAVRALLHAGRVRRARRDDGGRRTP